MPLTKKTIIFGTGTPKSATKSLAYFLRDVCGFNSEHEPVPSLGNMKEYTVFDPELLMDYELPVKLAEEKVRKITEFFTLREDIDNWAEVDWTTSWIMKPLAELVPHAKWIILQRDIDSNVESLLRWNGIGNWKPQFFKNLYRDVTGQIIRQLFYLDDFIIVNFDEYIANQATKKIIDFVGRQDGSKSPEDHLAIKYNTSRR